MPDDKELYGFLYPKKDRTGNQPNLTGKILIEGKEWELAGWTKTARSGVKYVSLKAQEAGGGQQAEPAAPADSQDDIPF